MDKKKLEEYTKLTYLDYDIFKIPSWKYENISIKAIDTIEGKIKELTRKDFDSINEYNIYLGQLKWKSLDKLNGLTLRSSYYTE